MTTQPTPNRPQPLSHYRERLHLSQAALAEALQVHRETIIRIEQGKAPRATTRAMIERYIQQRFGEGARVEWPRARRRRQAEAAPLTAADGSPQTAAPSSPRCAVRQLANGTREIEADGLPWFRSLTDDMPERQLFSPKLGDLLKQAAAQPAHSGTGLFPRRNAEYVHVHVSVCLHVRQLGRSAAEAMAQPDWDQDLSIVSTTPQWVILRGYLNHTGYGEGDLETDEESWFQVALRREDIVSICVIESVEERKPSKPRQQPTVVAKPPDSAPKGDLYPTRPSTE
jgi:DNA-binding XRE family transcriptional regulator